MFQRRTRATVGFFIGLVLIVVNFAGLAQAKQPPENRFIVLPPGDWVLDTTTSLRWQQSPGAIGDIVSPCDNGTACTWQQALDYCAALGNGSRLPEIRELLSLIDYSQRAPALPAGHPFSNLVAGVEYRAATTEVGSDRVWLVGIAHGKVDTLFKTSSHFVWCTR